MSETFSAIDVETANADAASICQIGIVRFVDGAIVEKWGTLVKPDSRFSTQNSLVHGISEEKVAGAPSFRSLADELARRLSGPVVASHTPFDRLSVRQAADRSGVEIPVVPWLDTATVVRRAWPQFSQRGYGLANIAEHLGIRFDHHDAVEDARAAGEVLIKACAVAQCSVTDWLRRVDRAAKSREPISRAGHPDGSLYGHQIVFTGALQIPRAQAAALAAAAGCSVAANVSTRTTLLVVGDQDLCQTKGLERSSKHRRAIELIADGHAIRILQESDFLALIEDDQ
jgi:DNA polymerase-3 subunit epsilon